MGHFPPWTVCDGNTAQGIFPILARPPVDPPQAAGERRRSWGMIATDTSTLVRVLRERTDVFERERSILAIAPGAEFEPILARIPHARATSLRDLALLRSEAESFDLVIADAGVIASGSDRAHRELARLLRPGGRLVTTVAAGLARACVEQLAAGFLVARAAEHRGSTVLVAIRGEFAAYAP